MKYKYIPITGFAFAEEGDMKRLSNYAKNGWILEDLSCGFFYKLRKDEPQNIIYTLDYQKDYSEEYFALMNESGWNHVLTSKDKVTHIFSAKEGTKNIYSDSVTEIDKYKEVERITKRGVIGTSILMVIIALLMVFSIKFFKPIFIPLSILEIINIIVFIFCAMPYIAYKSRIDELEKYGEVRNIKGKYMLYINMALGVLMSIWGIDCLIEGNYPLAILEFFAGFLNYKEVFKKRK